GFAEADPHDDLSGRDAAAKLAILSAMALNRPVCCTDISCRSIDGIEPIDFCYARELGCTIRQVAWADLIEGGDDVVAAVRPALGSPGSPRARVTRNQNVVTVVGELGGETAFVGQGAGGDATAVAVVSDLLAIAHASAASGSPSGFSRPRGRVSADYTAPHYIRFTVDDRP